jgi:hypothetical protein
MYMHNSSSTDPEAHARLHAKLQSIRGDAIGQTNGNGSSRYSRFSKIMPKDVESDACNK